MQNPIFLIFDGIFLGLKWVGKHFELLMLFLATSALWFLPHTFIVMVGKPFETFMATWALWASCLGPIFITVNFFAWLRSRFSVIPKKYNDAEYPSISRHLFVASFTGAILQIVALFVFGIAT